MTHAICWAHLLRELNGVIENHPEQTWAPKFRKLLLNMKKVCDKALRSDKAEVSYYYRYKFDKKYDDIIKTAYEQNPLPETISNKRGHKKKQSIKFDLQTGQLQGAVCLFINNLYVPFDNNLAEHDLRMIKGTNKVSECFRSEEGAQEYLTIMSAMGSAHKYGINAYKAIRKALDENSDIIFA